MEYRNLGKTGVKVSSLCMGTMSFGGKADKSASKAIFNKCLEAGVNFFDSANVYNDGESEKILGECIQGHRDELIITSKVYLPTGDNINDQGLSRYHITKEINKSLKRLKTEYLDIYFLHKFDHETAIENTLKTLDDMVRQGKVLYIGASNWAAWQIEKALGISREKVLERFEIIQPMYSLVKRQAEVEIFPMALEEELSVITYSPLGGGLLTGKYDFSKTPDTGRFAEKEKYQTRYKEKHYYETAERFIEFAKENGFHPVSLAIAWVQSHPAVTAPIIGANSVRQLEDSLNSINIDMTKELREKISSLSITPPPATDRLEEL